MLIGLCGGLCAGKQAVANYLVSELQFHEISLEHPGKENALPSKHSERRFANLLELMNFVTVRWRQHFVLVGVNDERILDELSTRPFFILVSVDAPVHVRWLRWKARLEKENKPAASLEEFVVESDKQMFDADHGIARIADRATIKLINSHGDLAALHRTLSTLDLANPERLRPGWDAYFMQLASLAARRSNCMKRRVGCVLVREKRVIATGYNGAPRGLKNCNEGGCGRCNSGAAGGMGLATCLCMHAEENALIEAGRERVGMGATLYCDTCPCLTCSIKIVQVGISEVVYSQGYSMDHQTKAIFEEAGVKLRQFMPPRDGLLTLQQ